MSSEPPAGELPAYRLFCATWGSFSPESGLEDLVQTQGSAIALSTAMKAIGALAAEPTLVHDVGAAQCLDELERFLEPGQQDVVLYFASHGLVPGGSNQFFRLATCETRKPEDMNRAFVVSEAVEKVAQCGEGRKLFIVDSCYSGKAATTLVSNGGIDLDLPREACLLLSTDPFTAMPVPPGEPLTPFTGGLAEVLMRGLEDRGPQLSVRSIYTHLHTLAQTKEMPLPELTSTGSAAETIAFRNVASRNGDGRAGGEVFAERVADYEHRTEILYIDDEDELREKFRHELEGAGHGVTLAADPSEGERALAAGHFDIVVIDLLLHGDVPCTEFIQLCSREAPDSQLFLVSRQSKSSEQNWMRLDKIFPYPSRISTFLWKPGYALTVKQHANRIRAARRRVLSHIEGLPAAVALVAERMIERRPELGERSERLQLEIRACVERMVGKWFPRRDEEAEENVYIENMEMRPISGGRSASVVFTLVPNLRGVEPESVAPLVLKLGPRVDIEEEVRRYEGYVQVGVPLDLRTDKIDAALVGGVGGVIYSFRGAEDKSIHDVSLLDPDEIEACFETLFGKKARKRWYASVGTGDGVSPTDHFAQLGFPPDRFMRTLSTMQGSLQRTVSALPDHDPARKEKLRGAFEEMTVSHGATLVHGDLTLENLVKISRGRFAIIDYRTVGLGPRLIDFATLEVACWLLAQAPSRPRGDIFVEALAAVPRAFQVDGGLDDDAAEVTEWLKTPLRLALMCRRLALENHRDSTAEEYASLLWLAALRTSEFRSRATTSPERNAQRVLLPAVALAAQAMIDGSS